MKKLISYTYKEATIKVGSICFPGYNTYRVHSKQKEYVGAEIFFRFYKICKLYNSNPYNSNLPLTRTILLAPSATHPYFDPRQKNIQFWIISKGIFQPPQKECTLFYPPLEQVFKKIYPPSPVDHPPTAGLKMTNP